MFVQSWPRRVARGPTAISPPRRSRCGQPRDGAGRGRVGRGLSVPREAFCRDRAAEAAGFAVGARGVIVGEATQIGRPADSWPIQRCSRRLAACCTICTASHWSGRGRSTPVQASRGSYSAPSSSFTKDIRILAFASLSRRASKTSSEAKKGYWQVIAKV